MEMMTEITTEINTEMMTTMHLPDQYPMVQYLIQSKCRVLAEEDQVTMETAMRPRRTMYLRVGLYIYPINTLLNMCHKLIYVRIGVLGLCCLNTKENTILINNKIDYIF